MDVDEALASVLIRQLPSAGSSLVLAVSAGADSMTLWHACVLLGRWQLTIWHLDHGLRAEASADGELLRRTAAAWSAAGLDPGSIVIEAADIAAIASATGGNVEQAGRNHRYERLLAIAGSVDAKVVVTAHHQDDQAETVLLQLRRGCGPDGPLGMSRRRHLSPGIELRRPLLDRSRAELRAHATAHGLEWLEDSTNADLSRTRNRIRAVLLPGLENLAPGATRALSRLADRGRRRTCAARLEARQRFDQICHGRRLDLARLTEVDPVGRSRIWRLLLDHLVAPVSRQAVDRIEDLVGGRPGRRFHLGTWMLTRRARDLVWEEVATIPPPTVAIAGPGVYQGAGCQLRIAECPPPADPAEVRDHAIVDADQVADDVIWRPLLVGERWRPLGGVGSQGVRKTLAARGIPAGQRATLAVLADAQGVIWAPGAGVAERVRIAPGCRRAWRCSIEPD